jgi:hypothetical protein
VGSKATAFDKRKIIEAKRGCIILNSAKTTVYSSVWLQLKFPVEARAVQELNFNTARVFLLKNYN